MLNPHAPQTKYCPEIGGEADASAWLAAIVDNSSDAILSKTLDSIITSWNKGAEHLFGYSWEEAVGQPITIIIPDDRLHEETDIISRLRRGERIDRLETIRCTKDRRPIEVELTISPVRDAHGTIIGASKIARDISERRRQAETQELLLREMNHRVKNLFSIIQGLIGLERRRATSIDHFANDLCDRLTALGAAHKLILIDPAGHHSEDIIAFDAVVEAVLAPYIGEGRVRTSAPAIPVGPRALTSLALLLHELATNAVKYGGLSNPGGTVEITAHIEAERLMLAWKETGGQAPTGERPGFGTDLMTAALRGLDGTIAKDWRDGILLQHISLPCKKLKV